MNKENKEIVISALGMALVFVATFVIHIPNGISGYIHLGDGFILLFASFVSPLSAFLIGGIGSALADVVGGYGYYFIFTLLIKGMMGFVVSVMLKNHHTLFKRSSAYLFASCIMVIGYLLADWIVNQSLALALAGVGFNLIQAIAGLVIGLVGYPILEKLLKHEMISA